MMKKNAKDSYVNILKIKAHHSIENFITVILIPNMNILYVKLSKTMNKNRKVFLIKTNFARM